ncbi:MAG: hypothetical protein WDO74_06665 [Pseudomonadota bacterium]
MASASAPAAAGHIHQRVTARSHERASKALTRFTDTLALSAVPELKALRLEAMLLDAFFDSGLFERLAVPSDGIVDSGPFGLLLQQVTVPSIDKRYRPGFAIINAAESLYLAVEVDVISSTRKGFLSSGAVLSKS